MYKYATGGKTGFTKKAKRTLINTASKDNLNLVVVTLNDGNDFIDHKNLFEYGFNTFKKYKILKKGYIEILNESYYKGYNFYIKNNFSYPLSIDEKDNIIIKFELKKYRKYKNNMSVGKAKVYLGKILLHEENVFIEKRKSK